MAQREGSLFLPLAIGLGVALVSTRAAAAPAKSEEEAKDVAPDEGASGGGGTSPLENAIEMVIDFVNSPLGKTIINAALGALGLGGGAKLVAGTVAGTTAGTAGGAGAAGAAGGAGAAGATPTTVQTGTAAIQSGYGATAGVVIGIVIVALVIAIIVFDDVVKKQKTWGSRLMALMPNAKHLCHYEVSLLEAFAANMGEELGGKLTFLEDGLRDVRLDQYWINPENPSERLFSPGRRPVVGFSASISKPWMGADAPMVAWLRLQKQARRLALEYLEFRYWAANNLLSEGKRTPNFGMYLTDMFNGDADKPNMGGLNNIPLPDGQTQYSARIASTQPQAASQVRHPLHKDYLLGRRAKIPYGPDNFLDGKEETRILTTEEMVARDATPDSSFLSQPGGATLLKAQRLKALLEVLEALQFHPGVVLFDVFDPRGWRDDVLRWLNMGPDFLVAASHRKVDVGQRRKDDYLSWCIVTEPSAFGVRAVIDVWQLRFPDKGYGTINPWVSPVAYKMFPPFQNPTVISNAVWFLDASRAPGDPEYFTPVTSA